MFRHLNKINKDKIEYSYNNKNLQFNTKQATYFFSFKSTQINLEKLTINKILKLV